MKANFVLKCCLFAVGVFGLRVAKNFATIGYNQNKQESSSFKSSASVAAPKSITDPNGLIMTPSAGNTYYLGYLFDLINANNGQQTSNFIVPATGTGAANAQPIPNSECWPSGVHLTMGLAADAVGLTASQLNPNMPGTQALRNTPVTLQQDPVLIEALSQPYNPSNQISATLTTQEFAGNQPTAQSYQKILLYFLYTSPKNGQVYRLYLNDVLPPRPASYMDPETGHIVTRNPAQIIISKWTVPAN